MRPRAIVKRSIERMPREVRREIRRLYYRHHARRNGFGPGEPEVKLVSRLLQPGDWVLDIGAYVGHYTIPAAREVGGLGRVISVEPLLDNFEILTSNVAAAGCRNVTLLNLAASEVDRTVRMSTPRWEDGSPASSRAHIGPEGSGTSALAYPLDRLKTGGMSRLRVVKVDVEGHESGVLEGMLETLALARPLIIVEASGNHRCDGVQALGYELERLDDSPNVLYARDGHMEAIEETRERLRAARGD